MDMQRAREIIESPDIINVTYNGEPIYIQNVNDNETATVYPLDDPQKEEEVPLNKLEEQ
ncbi:H-type small acid-soluble spore protein [Salirhabdus salicampi]|uniref:H-type small acid-soluble spore protein n=1 Tax=Salirhabdus salicampi TaxID=476102 RepID=UPI0020C33E9E|nr:H-type small acid-soluble spore protein [Salirhabdus salicampi]MCP8615467.1 H-type small acid-soluble spore protein [Salirhabdus salicampi]